MYIFGNSCSKEIVFLAQPNILYVVSMDFKHVLTVKQNQVYSCWDNLALRFAFARVLMLDDRVGGTLQINTKWY